MTQIQIDPSNTPDEESLVYGQPVFFNEKVTFFNGVDGIDFTSTGGIANITVVQTGYTGSNPIGVTTANNSTQIGIGATSNAYANRTVSTSLPGGGASPDNNVGNDGDIWYQIV